MKISATAPISRFNITLGDVRQNLRNIGEEWAINIMPPQRGRFFGSFGLKVHRDVNLVLWVKELPDGFEFANNLFRIRILGCNYDSGEDGLTIPLTLTNLKTRFQLFLNPAAIKDSTGQAQEDPEKEYRISFKLAIVNVETNEKIHSTEEHIIFSLAEMHTRPDAEIIIKKEWENFLYKREMGTETIGSVIINNPVKLKYYPSIDIEAKLHVTLKGQQIESNKVYLDFDNAPFGNDSFDSVEVNVFSIKDYGSTVILPNVNKEIEIPVIADIEKIGNPYEAPSRTYKLELELTFCHHGKEQNDVMKKTGSFTICRDAKKSELHVFSGEQEIHNGDTIDLPRTEFSFDSSSPYFRFPLTIKNTADSGLPHAGLIIGNFDPTVRFEDDNVKEVYNNGKEREEVFHFTDADGRNTFRIIRDGCHQIDSKPGGDVRLQLTFSGRDIKQLFRIYNEKRNYNTTALVTFTFNHWANDNGYEIEAVTEATKPEEFTATLRLPLFQKPCDKWLGIDFGTSAIVSMYDNQLLDLRKQKTELFKDEDPHYESGTPFLSSNTVFRKNASTSETSQLLSENGSIIPSFDSLAVCLSPTWYVEGQNHTLILPCLKMMVGYELLPQLETYPDEFIYYTGRAANRESHHLVENGKPTKLAYVDNIFDEVYRELFLYYIRKSLPQNVPNERINRLVLTIPNTYSPRHKTTLRSIVKQSLNHLDIRDICFVSESDAVACYYLKNRQEINERIHRSTAEISDRENIFVYDMGAGTLDLSLFAIEDAGDGTRKVTVLGKIGLSKAGNYLDFILANIMAEAIAETDHETAEQLQEYIHNVSIDTLASARALKSFIREKLKPALSNGTNELKLKKEDYKDLALTRNLRLHIANVIQHPKYIAFINECTHELINNFFNFLHLPAEFKLDTVIVSGRSSKLKQIHEALGNALEPFKAPSTFRIYNTSEDSSDVSKVAVVEGAMKYARELHSEEPTIVFNEDSITPCYGVIYKDQNGAEHYKELFNPRTTTAQEQEMDGMMVKTYRTEDVVLDLRYTDSLLLIQSYSGSTGDDWNNGKMDYISTVQTYSTTHFGRLQSAHLHVEVDTQNMLTLVVNNTASDDYSPNRIDLSRSSIADSLWPRVQVEANQN